MPRDCSSSSCTYGEPLAVHAGRLVLEPVLVRRKLREQLKRPLRIRPPHFRQPHSRPFVSAILAHPDNRVRTFSWRLGERISYVRCRAACGGSGPSNCSARVPGGRGVRRLRGRVRVPQGQGHAPNPRLGEGAPQPRAITCTVQAGENHTIITIDSTTRPPENAADAEDLIQPFHRGDDTRMANRPGHGLGLSIAKACTDATQATLAVSRPAPGTFRAEIKLPNRPTQRYCPQQKEHGHHPHAGQ